MYYTEPERNVYVLATQEQIREAQVFTFKNKLKNIVEECQHKVFWDEDSFLYTQRRCLACGCVIELI